MSGRRRETSALDNQLQADFATGPFTHKVLAGVDYIHSDNRSEYRSGFLAPIDAFAPVYGAVVPPADTLTPFIKQTNTQDQVGVYLQDQIKIDRFTLSLTGRHDWADAETVSTAVYPFTGTKLQKDEATTGRIGINYLFDFGLAPYASYTTSFQPIAGADLSGNVFKPTTGEGKEIGVKFKPNGMNLMLTAAVFEIIQQNVLTADPANVFFQVQTGEAKVRGVEFEARGNVTRELEIVGGYSNLDPKITKSNDGTVGNFLPQVALQQASLWAKYTWYDGPLAGLGLGAGVRYVGENYGDALNTIRIPSYTLFDAAISYDFRYLRPDLKGWSVQVNATNIGDRLLRVVVCDRARLLQPRRVPPRARHAALRMEREIAMAASRAAFRKWSWVHKWSSLVCTVFMLLLCVTGLPLIFHEEIDELLHEQVKAADVPARHAESQSRPGARQRPRQQRRGRSSTSSYGTRMRTTTLFLSVGKSIDVDPSTNRFVRVDAHTADYLDTPDFTRRFTYIMFKLHVDLFAGLPGKLFLGLMGILFCVAIISGIVVYAPSMRKLRFGTYRRDRDRVVRWLDVHNLAGVVLVMWTLVVGFTGVINTWADLVIKMWQYGQLAEMTASYRDKPLVTKTASLDAAMRTALAVEPDMKPCFHRIPGNAVLQQGPLCGLPARQHTADVADAQARPDRRRDGPGDRQPRDAMVRLDAAAVAAAAFRRLRRHADEDHLGRARCLHDRRADHRALSLAASQAHRA